MAKSRYRNAMSKARTLAALVLTVCIAAAPAVPQAGKPQRIVSMNQCTDLLVLMLASPGQIASVSFVTHQPQWTPPEYKEALADIPANHALAEEVIALKPDLVVSTPYTGGLAVSLLRRLGYRVETFEPEAGFGDIRDNIQKMGELLGEEARAQEAIREFDQRLEEIRTEALAETGGVIASFFVNGWMAGKNTLNADAAAAAGYKTLGEKMGYAYFQYVSLEQLIAGAPDLFAPSNAWTSPPSMATNALLHPAMRELEGEMKVVHVPERLLTCGSPAVLDAAELMLRARK